MTYKDLLYRYLDSDGDAIELRADKHDDGELGVHFLTPAHGATMYHDDLLEFAEFIIKTYDKMEKTK